MKRRDHEQTTASESLSEEQKLTRKQLVSSLVNAWLAIAEQCLVVVQVCNCISICLCIYNDIFLILFYYFAEFFFTVNCFSSAHESVVYDIMCT